MGGPVWPEGPTPDVGADERARFAEVAEAAEWHPADFEGEDDLDAIVTKTENEFLGRKEYIGVSPMQRLVGPELHVFGSLL